jgi:hypothetical protein
VSIDEPRPLVHIGYHKTGTTWLQRSVFDDLPGFQRPWKQGDLIRILVRVHDLDFDADAARRELAEVRSRAARPEVLDVVSLERLSGNPHSGGYDSRAIADRVGATFPEARVLIVIREQMRMIVSSYKQFVSVGGALSLGAYLDPPRRAERVPQFRFSQFEYDRLIAHYQTMFGADRVLVLPYERLAADPVEFVATIASFGDAAVGGEVSAEPKHPSSSAAALALRRRLNLFLVRDQLNPAALVDSRRVREGVSRLTRAVNRRLPQGLRDASERRLQAQVSEAIAGRFEDSNRRTTALTGLDLASLGYRVGE